MKPPTLRRRRSHRVRTYVLDMDVDMSDLALAVRAYQAQAAS